MRSTFAVVRNMPAREPGLQAGSPTYRGSDLRWNDFQTRRGYIGGTCAIESLIQSVAGASAGFGHQVAIRCSDTIRDRFWPRLAGSDRCREARNSTFAVMLRGLPRPGG